MATAITLSLFVLGFVFLIKGADLLVDGSSALAKRLKISDLVIGLTIVSFGTSAPEFIVNLTAAFNNNTDLALGNIIGSNICNILLILGIAALIYPIKVGHGTAWKEIPLSLLAAIVLGVLVNDEILDKMGYSRLSQIDGIILLLFFIIFLYYTFSLSKQEDQPKIEEIKKKKPYWLSIGMILIGLAGLYFGGQWIVNGAVIIAQRFGWSEALIGLTLVAVGTSLPELAASAMAAYKKNSDIAVGNAVGSNIFNIFWILGITSTIKPLPFNLTMNVDVFMVGVATTLLFSFLFLGTRNRLDRWQGGLFVLIYAGYLGFLVYRG